MTRVTGVTIVTGYHRRVATHDVTNQVPPLAGYDVFGTDHVLVDAVARWGDPADATSLHELGTLAGSPTAQALGRRRRPPDAAAADPPADRRTRRPGRLPPGVPLAARHRCRQRAHRRAVDAAVRVRRAPAARGRVRGLEPGGGRARLPGVDDVCGGAGSSPRPGPRRAVGSSARLPRLRAGAASRRGQGRRALRDGDDREAGRVRRAREHDARRRRRRSGARSGIPADRSQVVLLGADERRVPHARAGSGRAHLLRRAAGARRRYAQPVRDPAAQGQARQPVQRVAEVELDGTWGSRLGEEGRGVRTIIDMVAATRLDCVLGSAATMRAALTRAVHHARHRSAFGALLVDQPLMRRCSRTSRWSPRRRPCSVCGWPTRSTTGESAVPPARGRGGQVLGLQAHPADGRGGAGVPGRQRVRRGERAGAALPRGAAQLDLGGLRQRQRPRRPPRRRPGAARRRGARQGAVPGARAGPAGGRRRWTAR